ncbi:hypothetical protein T8K17_00170 [Thalassobaculum sp. OXR-137]|uniref:hypothetical protein n=1 Tax=Thalassobaculum sp. OXR-137 TaxID=3100173 RepID=UPI002AC9274F|nr:hypothetical protein [Thalassobaculum sp. OXR-137]WPZ34562.1 hypothetical protein T8K17_00170 [Thalassobaculum sp. OXR-137]
MKRLIAIAAMLLIILSTGMMGLAELHRGGTSGLPAPQVVAMHDVDGTRMSGHAHGHGDGKHDGAGHHSSCAIAGHTCAGYVTPELETATGMFYSRQDWSAPTHRLAAGLNAEATTPPPRA